MDKLHWKSATEIAALIRDRKLSASEALEHFLTRVDRFNPVLNAIIWQDRDRARRRAADGPLGGHVSRRHVPDFPPVFSSRQTPSMRMPRSAALHMS